MSLGRPTKRALVRALGALGLLVGACTLGARDDAELSGGSKSGAGGSGTGGSGATDGGGGAGNCSAGTKDCDGVAANGCEVSLEKDPNNCGACKKVCPSTGGKSPTCAAGVCGVSNCTAPQADCDGDGSCETDTATSLEHCGFCDSKCAPANAKAVCAMGCGIDECTPGFESCDGIPADGCETPLNTATDCGACGTACAPANATSSCATGACAITACTTGYADCDKLPDTGCESNSQTDPNNCGTCGTKCTTAQVCQAGKCVVSGCTPPTADCDNNPAACETNTDTSLAHCGFCNNPCVLAHATAACTAGKCTVATCAAGWADCDGSAANGCETQLNTTTNCKSCGDQCSGGANIVTATCTAAGCAVTCFPGYSNCNAVAGDGCEVQLATDPLHCGICTKNCSVGAPAGTQPGCVSGACTYNCGTGTADCDKNGSCETNLSTSTTNCGVCGRSCGATACVGGFCVPEVIVSGSDITSFDHDYPGTTSLAFGRNPGGVFRVNKTTKIVSPITTAHNAVSVDVVGTSTYFADPVAGIFRVPTAGGVTTTLTPTAGTLQLDTNSGNVWFTVSTAASVRRVSTGGGLVEPWEPQAGALRVVKDGPYVYWTMPALGEVRYSGDNTPNVQTLATAQGEPSYVVADGPDVYWTATSAGAIRSSSVGGPVTTVVTGQTNPYALAEIPGKLFWATKGTGSLWSAPKTGGTPLKLAEPVTNVVAILADSTDVYWIDSTGLKRVPQ